MLDIQYTNVRKMEPQLTERLRLAFPEKAFTIERVPQVMTVKEFERLSQLSPFIGLAWVGLRAANDSGRLLKGSMLWRLILIFKASNGLQTRFKGDARGLGLDAMVDVSIALLHGWTIKNTGHVEVTGANSVIADGWSDDNVVIAQVDFQVLCAVSPANLNLITPEDFRGLSANWLVEPDPQAIPVSDETTEEPDP